MAYKNNSCPEPKGILIIIGGKENKGENDIETAKRLMIFSPGDPAGLCGSFKKGGSGCRNYYHCQQRWQRGLPGLSKAF
jgi:hypothetical protein